jgi:hypothetical protein
MRLEGNRHALVILMAFDQSLPADDPSHRHSQSDD